MVKFNVILFTILFSFQCFSQGEEKTNPFKPSFGFNLGLNQSLLWNSNDTETLEIFNAPGFRMGVFAEFPLSKRWSVTPKSELSFNYGSIVQNDIKYRVDPYNLDFMLHLKYRFKGYDGNIQPYCSFGPAFRMPLHDSFEGTTYDTRSALALDFTFGLEIDAKYFYFSPELRFTGGLTDIRSNPSGNVLRGSNAVLLLNFTSK